MTKLHGRNAALWLDDQAGACQNVSGDLNNIDFNRSKNLPETTTFGDNSAQREVDGLKDATIDATIVWNTTATVAGIVEPSFCGLFMGLSLCSGGAAGTSKN